jgi:putative ABC transport system permease protein
MLGIIIGIASIIAIVSTLKGTNEQIKEDLIGAGNNTVSITLNYGDSAYDQEYGMGDGTAAPLLSDEQKEEVRKLDHIEDATFFYSRSYASNVYYQNTSFQGGSIYGIDMNYLETRGYMVRSGRGFIQKDFSEMRKVVLVDDNAAENLFAGENPVGKTIEIGAEPFTVVGVVQQSDEYLPTIKSIDEYNEYYQTIMGTVMIPESCWPTVFQFDEPQNAVIRADSTDNMSSAGSAAAEVMNQGIDMNSSKFKYKADDVMQQVRNMQKLSESTNTQLIWIASISLLVGGIGVMNIMLVSVTERTSEIGLKKAIGARKKVILYQFLTEAAMLTSIGGVIGVIVGIVLSKVVSRISGAPTAISIPAIIGSVVFSMLIGVIFGLLPSVKAADLNPIDALRSE